ncbi:MAG: hypothetical protein GWO02_18655 [Gammaproteobacteria bacterium]|nr:hypothetical protein [Gammaproteobacteria bacterium]
MPARRRFATDPFTDLLFNALLGFTFLFVVAILYVNPIAESGVIDPKAEMLITATWETGSPDDIDLWVKPPDGPPVYYNRQEVGLTHLERDDRGLLNDTLEAGGESIVNPVNQEVVAVRGTVSGEYVVNVHYYESHSGAAHDVSVEVQRLNPRLKVVYARTVRLERPGDERTVVRFHVAPDGAVGGINTLAKPMALPPRG